MKKGSGFVSVFFKIFFFIIIATILAPWIIPSFGHSPFSGPKGTIYVHDESSEEHYIAQFKASNRLCVYHYLDDNEDRPSISGVKTEFRCEGTFYNPLLGRIHTNPDPTILLWKNYAVFSDGEKQRAAVKLTTVDNYVAFATDDAAITGYYYDDISIGDDFLVLSGQKFTIPEGQDKEFAELVIEWFDTYAQEV